MSKQLWFTDCADWVPGPVLTKHVIKTEEEKKKANNVL